MARFSIHNNLTSQLVLPPPVSRIVAPGGTITADIPAASLEDAHFKDMINRNVIDVTPTNDPNMPDELEVANAQGVGFGFTGAATTTDATVTVVATIPVPTNTAYFIEAKILGRETVDSDEAGGYDIKGTFLNDGGVLAQVGATTADAAHETTVAWAVDFNVSGQIVQVRVTGAAATNVAWRCRGMIHSA
jgi:hypothetical protein